MALDEEEQLLLLRQWWHQYRKFFIGTLVLVLALVLGWQFWAQQRAGAAQEAAQLYQELLGALSSMEEAEDEEAETSARYLSGQLHQRYSRTLYGSYGALFQARFAMEDGQLEEARQYLQEAMTGPGPKHLRHLARLRLARVLGAQQQAAQGLELLEAEPRYHASLHEEIRGDLELQLGRVEQALAAYRRAARVLAEEGGGEQPLLRFKLERLEGQLNSSGKRSESSLEARPEPVQTEAPEQLQELE